MADTIEPVLVPGLWDDGNAFAIMGKVVQALRRAHRRDDVERYKRDATAGDYDNLLQVTMRFAEEA